MLESQLLLLTAGESHEAPLGCCAEEQGWEAQAGQDGSCLSSGRAPGPGTAGRWTAKQPLASYAISSFSEALKGLPAPELD